MKFKGILLDIGGVFYDGENVINGAQDALMQLRKKYLLRFLSNTSRTTPQTLLQKLLKMEFDVREEELFTAVSAAKSYIEGRGAYVVATDEVRDYFGSSADIDVVLICDAYTNFTYQNLNTAFRHLERGCELLATNDNRYFRDSDGELSLDAGGFVRCLEYASQKRATILGKPNCAFFHLVLKSMGLSAEEVIMVGDDIETDILGAQKCGLRAVMVKTGKFRNEDLQKGMPDFIIDSIAELPKLLKEIG
ncbi:hypothetical protein NitYY0826_C1297 [Nitratiruptor sp. YY08-26]|uniref:TIGR01458 family HAD-type hydrolase n=1 Tax=unclassified Nitratiruptor TaxID=2624044 RepID=UPI00191584A7|nr:MULTISPECIES: TIGR01458 family HAD-type hydrolase [unclassified Nitratiruptor]BCD62421.1 hypothetical protein NitYY0813_C1295 [Nitratiruptor sp. YY08-13]BCD66357.1 hypothetical protein NitYY0826_C1297 [Nitratiruptor sp. YY08-26]